MPLNKETKPKLSNQNVENINIFNKQACHPTIAGSNLRVCLQKLTWNIKRIDEEEL